jgi:hypothetical protein
MTGEYRPLPFRWILPLAQILLSVVFFWPLRHVLVWQIRSSVDAYRRRPTEPFGPIFAFSSGEINSDSHVVVVDPHLVPQSPGFATVDYESKTDEWRYWTPLILNLPAGLLSVPYAIVNPEKTEWTPRGMNFRYWRGISWPLVGMVFWWLAGRGIEALVAAFKRKVRPPLRPVEMTVAVLFVLAGAMCFLAPLIGRDPNDPDEILWIFMCSGGAMWFFFGSATIVAGYLQRRIRRGHARQTVPPLSPA